MRTTEQETSNGKGMYEKHKGTEKNDETDEIRSDARVWRLGEDNKRLVYADNPNVEVYEKQLNNRRLPQEDETDAVCPKIGQ